MDDRDHGGGRIDRRHRATAVIRQRPRLVITAEGFTIYKLVGEESRKWEETQGEFAVIKIGWNKAVGYNLTTGQENQIGAKCKSLFSGYDAAIGGAFRMPAERLADLLNAHARQGGDSAVGDARDEDSQAEPVAATGKGRNPASS